MNQALPCLIGMHRWLFDQFDSTNGYIRIRKTCKSYPSRKYGWKLFGIGNEPFGWADDRTAWDANPAILDPKRKKVTQ